MLDRRSKRQHSRQDLRGYEQKPHEGRQCSGRASLLRRSPHRKYALEVVVELVQGQFMLLFGEICVRIWE
jgi:hypothetical protein